MRRTSILRIAIVSFAVIALLGGAGGRPEPVRAATGTGSIRGVITDTSGAPIAGVTVSAATDPCCLGATATTTAGGVYTIAGLAPSNTYSVRAEAPGFVPRWFGNAYVQNQRKLVSVGSGPIAGINITLERAASISGTITDASSAPLAGASVTVSDSTGALGVSGLTTSTDGTYTAAGLPPGSYTVQASMPGLATRYFPGVTYQGDATPVLATEGSTTLGIDVALPPFGSISGTVTDGGGVPLSGITVRADANGSSGSATTAGDGTYTIAGLAPASYSVFVQDPACVSAPDPSCLAAPSQYYAGVFSIDAATPVSVTGGADSAGIDMSLIARGSITGTITDPTAAPVAGAVVSVVPAAGSCCYASTTTTATDGSYALGHMPPGSFIVSVQKSCAPSQPSCVAYPVQEYGSVFDFTSPVPVAVTSGQATAGIDIALHGGGGISGTVRLADGTPLAGAFISAQGQVGAAAQATTASDGSYQISALVPGTNDLTVSAAGLAGAFFPGVASVTDGATTAGVDLTMPDGRIAGVVRDSGGNAIASAHVTAFYFGTHASANTAADGTYTIGNLPTLTYQVAVSAPGYVAAYYPGVQDQTAAAQVSVTDGVATSGIDVTLYRAGTISGTVRDPEGAVIPTATVIAASGAGGVPAVNVAADGTYRIGNLLPGTYTVRFAAPGFDTQYYDRAADAGSAAPVPLAESDNATGIDAILHCTGDADCDGLSPAREAAAGTDPNAFDSDGDGIGDGLEVDVYHTNPLAADSDGDGYSDSDEIFTYNLDPLNADTDGDGCGDKAESAIATDPKDGWDFYSVPVPALFAAPNPVTDVRDRAVTGMDAQAVFAYFKAGAKAGAPVYDQDLNGNGIKDGLEYDRSVIAAGESGAPDGAVGAGDAQLAFAQFKLGFAC